MNAVSVLPMVSELLKRGEKQMAAAIPKGVALTVQRLTRLAITQVSKNQALAECAPQSIALAVLEAAQMGLEFGEMKQCALVPYNNHKKGVKECKLMVQYQGWLALLWRSKSIKEAQARIVYEGDFFDVEYGSSVSVIHKPAFKSSVPLFYYACATPTDGTLMVEVMPLAQVEAHRDQYAKGLDKKDSPWNTAFDEMAKKTVLRKLIKLLPLDPNSAVIKALELDEKIWEADKEQARMEKFHEITAESAPTEDDKVIAYKQYSEALITAHKLKIDLKDLPQNPDRNDVKRLIALTDAIGFRIEVAAGGANESTYE